MTDQCLYMLYDNNSCGRNVFSCANDYFRDDIGEHMRAFAEEHGLLKRPADVLLNSYFAKKILLASPLLQWLLQKGLRVTKVYTVVQYKSSQCFRQFGEEVMNARRAGDTDSTKKIIGDMCKLLGKFKR